MAGCLSILILIVRFRFTSCSNEHGKARIHMLPLICKSYSTASSPSVHPTTSHQNGLSSYMDHSSKLISLANSTDRCFVIFFCRISIHQTSSTPPKTPISLVPNWSHLIDTMQSAPNPAMYGQSFLKRKSRVELSMPCRSPSRWLNMV